MIEVHYRLVDLIERVKVTNIDYYTSELVSPFLTWKVWICCLLQLGLKTSERPRPPLILECPAPAMYRDEALADACLAPHSNANVTAMAYGTHISWSHIYVPRMQPASWEYLGYVLPRPPGSRK